MAKTKIFGDSVVMTSSVKLADLKNIAKYAPKALTLMGGEDGKEPIFSICIGKSGAGSLNAFGATFAPATRGHHHHDDPCCGRKGQGVGCRGIRRRPDEPG